MDTEALSALIEPYEYGQFNVLDNGMQITYNRIARQIKLDPFYRHAERPTQGSCSELMVSAYLDIKERFPDAHVTRVVGTEPRFFNGSSTHCFLFVSEGDLMDGRKYTQNPTDIEDVVSQDPLIVDPSFNKVGPLSDSGYTVINLRNEGHKSNYFDSVILNQGSGVPLGISSNGALVGLTVNFASPYLMDIVVKYAIKERGHYFSDYDRYGFSSPDLDKVFKDDPKILEVIKLLKTEKRSSKFLPLRKGRGVRIR
jgi:hypothetical protein